MKKLYTYYRDSENEYYRSTDGPMKLITSKIGSAEKLEGLFITFNQSIKGKEFIDIGLAQKCLLFEKNKPVTLDYLSKLYFHKKAPKFKTVEERLTFYERLFNFQKVEIGTRGQTKAVGFEKRFSKYLSMMNNPMHLDIDLINIHIKKGQDYLKQFETNLIKTKTELIKYVKDKDLYDIYTGKWSFNDKSLKALNDANINKYIARRSAAEKVGRLIRYVKNLHGKVPDWRQIGTKTGRVDAPSSEAIGVPKKYYEKGRYVAYDYVANELMVYMSYFRPRIYEAYKESGAIDFYGFLHVYLTGSSMDPDSFKEKDPRKRRFYKDICIQLMNSGDGFALAQKLNLDIDKISKYIDAVSQALEIKRVREQLLKLVKENGAYSVCPKLGKSVRLPETIGYAAALKGIEGRNKNTAEGRSYFHDLKQIEFLLKRRIVAMRVQGTASLINKQAIMEIFNQDMGNHLILTRYDEVVVDIDNDDIGKCLKVAYKKIMDDDIHVSKEII